MARKKVNHYIPRMILKHWNTTNEEDRKGVYVLERSKGETYFSYAKGKGGYSFASSNYLYVPNIDGIRKENLEDWFSKLERSLDKTIRKIELGRVGELFRDQGELSKLILAMLSFQYRSKFAIESTQEFLQENLDVLKKLGGNNEKDINLIALENIVNSTNNDFAQYSSFKLLIMRSKSGKLIFGDLPFINDEEEGYLYLPITKELIIGLKKEDNSQTFTEIELSEGAVNIFNVMIAEQSKYWIVADNKEQLEKYEDNLNTESKMSIEYINNHLFRSYHLK